ncbi:MAG: serine protease [Prevotella sp.]|nr:serine protease [Prevotella sp.]
MKTTIPALLLAALMTLFANYAHAQAKWAKNVAKTTFTLKTFSTNGNLIGSYCGFYVGTDGEAVANFTPFKGASRAVVIDANGVEQQVECIIGANDIYDVAKFKVSAGKTQPVTLAASALQKDNIAWFMPYAVKKTPEAVMGTVTRVEQPADKYSYYTLQMQVPETAGGCPVLNDNGEVVGIMQQPANGDKNGYATDVRMATDLTAKPLMINDPTLSKTMLKKALPDDIKEATVTLMTMQTMADSLTLATTIEDFIKKFPNSAEGYKSRAQSLARAGRHADADRDMQQAIKTGTELDDTYYTYARMIYSHQLYEQPEKQYAPWTLEFAEDAINKAYTQNPQPLYLEVKAQIKFSQKQYAEAYDVYKQLIDNGNATAENYYGAARCKEQTGDSITMLALLDSAVATFSEPYIRDAAPYFWARAEARMAQGKMREAVQDLNVYEKLMPQVNDRFYYIRFEAESKCRLFQQALNDIRQAISKDDRNAFYYAEKASLEIRVKLYDDAIDTAQQLINLESENSDGYLFLGLAQCLKGDKAAGTKNLEKAKQLGDTQAQSLIEKYGK